jgi:hypothetical protein
VYRKLLVVLITLSLVGAGVVGLVGCPGEQQGAGTGTPMKGGPDREVLPPEDVVEGLEGEEAVEGEEVTEGEEAPEGEEVMEGEETPEGEEMIEAPEEGTDT